MNQQLWDKMVEEHGHSCMGLAIGYRMAEEAKRIFSKDEKICCVAPSTVSSCSVDGVCLDLGLSLFTGTMRLSDKAEGFIFFAEDDDEGWLMRTKKLDVAPEADPVFLILASARDNLFDIEPCDIPITKS